MGDNSKKKKDILNEDGKKIDEKDVLAEDKIKSSLDNKKSESKTSNSISSTEDASFVDQLIEGDATASPPLPELITSDSQKSSKTSSSDSLDNKKNHKKSTIFALMTVLILLFLIPIAVLYIGNKNVSLGDIRNCAAGGDSLLACANPTSTPTPTTIQFECEGIEIYKDGVLVIDMSTLMPGDEIEVVVTGSNATQARARINLSPWDETSSINAQGKFVFPYILDSEETDFLIEAEVFLDGVWK
ncbi:hypothetical protein ACFL1A_03130 [Patescibacteria group bacterium]